MDYKEVIATLLAKQIPLKKDEILRLLEVPKNTEFGDFSFPCFSLAPLMRKNPNEIAKIVAESVGSTRGIVVTAVNAYVNFSINKESMAYDILSKILKEKDKFGSSNEGHGRKVIIEHSSINPNSPPHVGHARNAILGDIITRLLKFQGFDVKVHYYVNDAGKLIAILVLGAKGNEKFEKMLEVYVKTAKKAGKSKKFEKKAFDLLNKFEAGDKDVIKQFNRVVKTCINGQKKILDTLGIKFDVYDYESRYLLKDKDKLMKLLDKLKETGKIFVDDQNRIVLNQEGSGLEKEMKKAVLVLTRGDGTSLYVLRDLAYTIDKMEESKNNIVVLGEEHKLYFKQLSAALKLLGLNVPKVVHYSFILISTAKGAKKMSKRKGDVVMLQEFIDEAIKKAKEEIKKRKLKTLSVAHDIGIGAVRYSIAKVEENKNVVFDWQDALNFEGNSGPYLQYTYARASNILKKVKDKTNVSNLNLALLKEEKENELVTVLSKFAETVEKSADTLSPHIIANYALNLCETFNSFYQSCPVLKAENGVRKARIALVEASRQVLENVLNLLGIKPLKRM
jgi:arginyl-tRNA synthetase